ncbi:MAG: GNAT family protein, partial [Steroidobacteraceae bacterium]
AIRAALAWSDEHFGTMATTCIIDPVNLASIRIAEKHGYREFARGNFKGEQVIQFRRSPA